MVDLKVLGDIECGEAIVMDTDSEVLKKINVELNQKREKCVAKVTEKAQKEEWENQQISKIYYEEKAKYEKQKQADEIKAHIAQGVAICVVIIFLVYTTKKIIKMPKNWRIAYALSALWVIGVPVFFWVFYREFGYSGEDVAKISLGFPPFGIFSYWLLMKAAK